MTPILRTLLGAALGAGLGFAIYKFVGCRTGACPLTASPWTSMFIYGTFGALMAAGR